MLYAGHSRKDITPPLGTILFGYPNRRPAKEVLDPLTVDALALRDGEKFAIIVSAAILLFDNDRVKLLRARISEEIGIPVESLFLHAIHTHSGPESGLIPGWSSVNEEYCQQILEPTTLEACKEAWANLEPAQLGVASGNSDAAVNRRQVFRDGTIGLGQNPWGTFDPNMTVLTLRGENGIIANLVHYGCHCTAAGANDEITRDWAGVMIDRMEEITGGKTMFINGCEGDVGPRLSNGSTAHSTPYLFEMGERAAHDAVRIWNTIREYRDAELQLQSGTQALDYCPLPDREAVIAEMENIRTRGGLEAMNVLQMTHLEKVLEVLDSNQDYPRQRVTRQTVLKLGPVVFIPFEYEMFCGVSLRLREHSGMPYTLCMSNTNGYLSYFPTKDQIPLGGYEIEDRKAAGAFVLADYADDQIVEANLQIIDAMKK
ncbi:MAG: hypothetical protein IJY82_01100 [Oscillospiraceae bacterium]|nr:hypothetical protein [Oscillospiraceae bacterium]